MTPAFSSLADFFAMGGYSFYVWLSFGLTALCMAGLGFSSWRERRIILRDVLQRSARARRMQQAHPRENQL
ncbi:MAG: heme exporter protein CcmD [Plesiomonas sp.]|uniref:heme exporter protein CcmD n=1 Tax=Plesiomonas sp. TaxID=2486279 RepID=UPI003F3BF4DD